MVGMVDTDRALFSRPLVRKLIDDCLAAHFVLFAVNKQNRLIDLFYEIPGSSFDSKTHLLAICLVE